MSGLPSQTSTEHLGVKEHEIVIQAKKRYTDGRLRVFSALNNIVVDSDIIKELVADNIGLWAPNSVAFGPNDSRTIAECTTNIERRIARNYPDEAARTLAKNNEKAQNASLNRVLHARYTYVGVAITPQNLYPKHSKQDPQGFAVTRGGLNTIINTGNGVIHPGQRVNISFGSLGISNADDYSNPSHYSRGIPHDKLLVQTVGEDTSANNNSDDHIDLILQNMYDSVRAQQHLPTDPNQTHVRVLNTNVLANGNGIPDAIFTFHGLGPNNSYMVMQGTTEFQREVVDVAKALHGNLITPAVETEMNRQVAYLIHCSVDVINSTRVALANTAAGALDTPDPAAETFAAVAPHYTSFEEFRNDNGAVPGGPIGPGAYKCYAVNRVMIPIRLDAAGRPVISNRPLAPIIGLEKPDGAGATELQTLGDVAAARAGVFQDFMVSTGLGAADTLNDDGFSGADRQRNIRLAARAGDSLEYALRMMLQGPGDVAVPDAPINRRVAPLQAFIRRVVRTAIRVHEKHRQKSIGIALPGARPGQPFDICLTDS